MRIAGINIPKEKKILFSLRYIYGVGPTLAEKVLKKAKIDGDLRTKDLTPEQEDKLRAIVEKEHVTEGDLRREVGANIKRLKDVKCYRGIRHHLRLPLRGQRTKSNFRRNKGKASGVNKKKR